jgi:hypothetical protein
LIGENSTGIAGDLANLRISLLNARQLNSSDRGKDDYVVTKRKNSYLIRSVSHFSSLTIDYTAIFRISRPKACYPD